VLPLAILLNIIAAEHMYTLVKVLALTLGVDEKCERARNC